MRRLVLSFLILACACVPAWAQEATKQVAHARAPRPDARPAPPITQHRISGQVYVGETAPDFELTTSAGRELTLSSLRGDWVLLYFARDRRMFEGVRTLNAELAQLGVKVIGICKDNPQSLRSYVGRQEIPFEILADATGEISALYGLFDPTTTSSRDGCVVVDRRGIVRLVLQGEAAADQVAGLAQYTVTGVQRTP